MSAGIRKEFKRSRSQFKWGGDGNLTVLYKVGDMKFFRKLLGEKDAARIALHNNLDDVDFNEIDRAAAIEAWTWDQKEKVNRYDGGSPTAGGIGMRSGGM